MTNAIGLRRQGSAFLQNDGGAARLWASSSRIALLLVLGAAIFAAPVQAAAKTIQVRTGSQLFLAFEDANSGDTISITPGAIVELLQNLPVLNGKNITIDGNGATIVGDQYRGIFVQSGTVTINNLGIFFAKAVGGNGGNTYSQFGVGTWPPNGSGGGGAAGLGAGLFIASGATVIASGLSFVGNQAIGGHGGGLIGNGATQPGGGGGGGMFGNGSSAPGAGFGGGGGAGYGPGGGAGGTNAGFNAKDASRGLLGGGGGGYGALIGCGGGGVFGGGGGGGGPGGFGAGSGNGVNGGGGAAMGGAIFVQEGGTLTLAGSLRVDNNTVTGGGANLSA
jgi:hypothetical protein